MGGITASANDPKSDTTTREQSIFPGLYAPSGIDMMSILLRVYQRPNPKVQLGAVDFNCAIIVCDTFAPDHPIIYCSQAFETLTGYQKHEIIGRNCRFLQSPYRPSDSRIGSETNAGFEDQRHGLSPASASTHVSMYGNTSDLERPNLNRLKAHLERKEEAQVVITNYRKDGSPFQNILTTIPIPWESEPDNLRYVVGFQVDQGTLF